MGGTDLSRRGFLRAAAAATVAVGTGAFAGSAAHAAEGRVIPSGRIGIQLWSVRDKVRDLGFRTVFEELSRIGYHLIEFAGYSQPNVGPITIAEIRQLLDDNGLKAAGSHIGLNSLLNPGAREREFETALQLGMQYIGTASNFPGNTVAEIQAGADRFNEAGEAARESGLRIYQHNHTGEFAPTADEPNLRRYDVFLEHTDPRFVFLQLDILWSHGGSLRYRDQLGEFNPVDYVNAAPQRFLSFHVKDGVRDPSLTNQYRDVVFGAGEIDFRAFFGALEVRGLPLYLWEEDRAPVEPLGSFWAAETSYDRMVNLRS